MVEVEVGTQKREVSLLRHPLRACQVFSQNKRIVLPLDEITIISTSAHSKVYDKFLLHLKINHEHLHISTILSNMAFD